MLLIDHMPLCGLTGHEAGRMLLRRMYRAQFGAEPPEIRIAPRGKPCFEGDPVFFSITHTPHHAFCALSDRPVGIDAEELDRKISLKLAGKILSPAEKRRFDAAPDREEFLLRLWVLKEALVKCSGEGLRGYPDFTDFTPNDPRIRILEGCFVAVISKEEAHAL